MFPLLFFPFIYLRCGGIHDVTEPYSGHSKPQSVLSKRVTYTLQVLQVKVVESNFCFG